ncbi:glutathione S-transferase family protein [Aspergillus tubingensis]|uniref:glutathione S-transferase family protein n=1 Tax=Aspergillus tubingensis TaxID=5068 RepID=UPI001579023E|nr:glutathione S-transferase [Aspergillus tubingensis]GFN16894.1 glutathione S-transferase [Aspergillus tubingensis]
MPLTPKVYGSVSSTCTQRVLIVLEELEIDYELIPINMRAGEHKGPSYLSEHNPFGYIPAYQDKDVKIFESRAICHYLAAKSGGHLVPPSNPLKVAEFQQAASVEYSYFDPPMKQLAYESLFKSMMGHGEPDTSLVSLYKDQIRKCLDYYEGILEKQDYLGGTTFSLVDVYHMPWTAFMEGLGLWAELESRKYLRAWWERVESRPSWKSISGRS